MKLISIISISTLILFSGCNKIEPIQPHIDTIVIDTLGQKYRFVSPEVKNKDGTFAVELWEKIDPLDTNRWYTPSLSSKFNTNSPLIFSSLLR